MKSGIVVSNGFAGSWPFAAEHARARWATQGPVELVRLPEKKPACQAGLAADCERLLLLGGELTAACLQHFGQLREVGLADRLADDSPLWPLLKARDIQVYRQQSEGFWGQSVSEFALALTLCGLRRIPQTYAQMRTGHEAWDYSPPGDVSTPGARGFQFGDDPNFTHGTLAGKRVRVIGMGNIGARFASFCHFLGADVAGWDPMAPEPAFHRSGARRVWRMEELVDDAQIFAPMLPLRESTRGLVNSAILERLPRGTLVVMVTRMQICDSACIRRLVLEDKISLAADVFDVEPLPLDDPLLGRHNVVHTPHNAGRTADANCAFVDALLDQFAQVTPAAVPTR